MTKIKKYNFKRFSYNEGKKMKELKEYDERNKLSNYEQENSVSDK